MYGIAHGLSYLLDPRFLGTGLSQAHRTSTPADDLIAINDERKEKLYIQLNEFFISALREKETNAFRFQLEDLADFDEDDGEEFDE